MSANGNAPDFDPLNPTPQEEHDMLGGYLAAGGKVGRPALCSAAFEHGWRMRRNDMAGVADDDQRALVRRAALTDHGQGRDRTMRPDILLPKEVAAEWGCSERHVRNMVARGELGHLRLGGEAPAHPARRRGGSRMPNDGDPYEIGRLNGECVLTFWRDEDGVRKRKRFRLGTRDPAEARRLAPAVYAQAIVPKGSGIKDLWDAYLADKEGAAVTRIMPFEWKALAPRFGGMNAEDITIEDCRAYIRDRRALGRKDGTIITELGRLRMVLKWAEKRTLIAKAPHIERPAAVKSSRDKHLTAHQVRQLADACKTPHLALFVHVAYATAGRAAAILGLTWDRVHYERGKIDLEDPEIKVAHKGRAVVPLTRTLRLRLLEAQGGARSPYVIEWAGERVGSVKKGLATAAKAAGLPHVHPHMLRHSAAVRQAEMGVPMEEIASYLGHSNPTITRRIYARFSPEALSKGAAALELDDFEPKEVARRA